MVSKAALEAHKKAQENTLSKSGVSSNTAATAVDQILPEDTLQQLSARAKESVENQFGNSPNFEFACKRLQLFPKFDFGELQLGNVLGKGQFGVVSEVKGVTFSSSSILCPKDSVGERESEEVDEDRNFIRQHCIRDGEARYAIKILNQEHFREEEAYYIGVHDLAVEAHFLAAIEHPNILKLRGLSSEPLGGRTFFLLLDRLYGTLKERLVDWRLQIHKMSRGLSGISKSGKEKKKEFMKLRMRAAVDLSSAVMYLHQNHIMDRDLKPENVGFDIRGDIKLFDFGLSREFEPDKGKPYKMTGMTGSLLYMAPENYFEKPYDESIDIFSLGIIFWELISLDRLYPNFNSNILKDMVMKRGVRPAVNSKWSQGLQNLLRNMWSSTASERPTARQVNILIKHELAQMGSEEEKADNRQMMRRRSTFVQRRFVSKRNLNV